MKNFILLTSSFILSEIPLLPRNCKGYESRKKATAKLKVREFKIARN
jgi:hypothetical protein